MNEHPKAGKLFRKQVASFRLSRAALELLKEAVEARELSEGEFVEASILLHSLFTHRLLGTLWKSKMVLLARQREGPRERRGRPGKVATIGDADEVVGDVKPFHGRPGRVQSGA